jgi:hypothetical protein
VYAGDTNGDGRHDLFFNHIISTDDRNITVIATSNGDGDFTVGSNQEHPVKGPWHVFDTFVGDVNGDGRADLFWARGGRANDFVRVYLGVSSPSTERTLAFRGPYDRTSYGMRPNVVALGGDVNGDGRGDVVIAWAEALAADVGTRSSAATNPVLVGLGTTTSSVSFLPAPLDSAVIDNKAAMKVRLADRNGDGRADLLWNELGTDNQNRVSVSLAKADGRFDFSTQRQAHTVERPDWTQFEPYLADVSENGRQDVIWIHTGVQTRIYAGLSVR